MNITHSTPEDIDNIFAIYDAATAYQKAVTDKSWRGFERSLIEKEIEEKRHFKIIEEGNKIACTFVITYNDPTIWGAADDKEKAVYLHRIATHPDFRGRGYIHNIVDWVKDYAKVNEIEFIRMDTFSGNDRLNKHYFNAGFVLKRIKKTTWSEGLPVHYQDGDLSLFEIKL